MSMRLVRQGKMSHRYHRHLLVSYRKSDVDSNIIATFPAHQVSLRWCFGASWATVGALRTRYRSMLSFFGQLAIYQYLHHVLVLC